MALYGWRANSGHAREIASKNTPWGQRSTGRVVGIPQCAAAKSEIGMLMLRQAGDCGNQQQLPAVLPREIRVTSLTHPRPVRGERVRSAEHGCR
jgi:hypothetical protein